MIEFRDLPSRTPEATWRTAERTDPFWGGVWVPRSATVWVDRKTARMQHDTGVARVPREFRIDEETAFASLGHSWDAKVRALSVLDAVRTASGEQLAAMTGFDQLASTRGQIMHRLFALGLVDYAESVTPFRVKSNRQAVHLWRPSVQGHRMRARLERERLTWPEWVLASGGRPWTAHRQSSRHDVLTTELLLRAAEFLPQIVGTAGEKFCRIGDVLYDSWPHVTNPPAGLDSVADAMLVRRDGLRILIETTATGSAIAERARRYAGAMAAGSLSTQGTVVVFLAASRPDADGGSVMHDLRRVVRRAIREHPGDPGARTADRLLIADWATWFPEKDSCDESFLQLRCERYAHGADGTEPFDLLGMDTPLPRSATAMAGQLAALWQSPWWLRQHAPSMQLAELRTDAFFGGTPPLPDRREQGVAAKSGVPARLRS